jgi:hypothetical protein
MQWFHKVDPEWLTERKKYLTASDIKRLIPVTASGRPRANLGEMTLKVWADKQCAISDDDICSTGAMARGHLLEPYAINEFNQLGAIPQTLYHWDDCLVYSADMVSCSPDSLDIPQEVPHWRSLEAVPATAMGEVKAYAAEGHYLTAFSPKMTLEERWQIAVAFYTMPTLVTGALILFNPSANHPLFYHLYTRAELVTELEMIKNVVHDFKIESSGFGVAADLGCPATVKDVCIEEDEIIANLIEEQAVNAGLNP